MTEQKTYPRLVSWSYYPASPYLKGDKELLVEIYLDDPKGEAILEQGILPSLGISMRKAPYFTIKRTQGRTKKARTHGDMKKKIENKYPELKNKLKSTDRKILDFGEYIFIDLPFINNYVNPIVTEDKWYNEQYIKKTEFTVDFIKELIKYRPIALFNRKEITDFQEESLPSFLRHLSIFDKDLYEEAVRGTRFEREEVNYKNLKAKLNTLKPGPVGYRLDISIEEFYWDGELLTRKQRTKDNSEVIVRPSEEVIVRILDNNTVTKDTEFAH